ncbi:MAG: serine/threonine protein kinase [Candidatus Bathyarchaeia archaeon]
MDFIVPVKELFDAKYGHVICYPRYDLETLKKRIEEIRGMGIKAILFSGDKMIAGVPVLGKGCVGIVVAAISWNNRMVALKILRTDAEANRLLHEAEMLQIANSVNVGPKLLGYSENFLVMEHIKGELITRWVEGLSGDKEITFRRLSVVLRDILEQCWRLDSIGLDHGELGWADKHIIIDAYDKPYILDFETASNRRRTINVTSISQYLFIKGRTAEIIAQKFRRINASDLIQALRKYKAEQTRERFELILRIVGL